MAGWTYWEWVAYAIMLVGAIIIAADQGLKMAPDILRHVRGIISNPYWAFSPLVLILLATLILLGREFGYLGSKSQPSATFDPDKKLELVYSKPFKNQTVFVDGYNFMECTFDNVTFVYKGTAPFHFEHSYFPNGTTVRFGSTDPAVNMGLSVQGELIRQGQFYEYRLVPREDLRP
jgi:hypothetical protein